MVFLSIWITSLLCTATIAAPLLSYVDNPGSYRREYSDYNRPERWDYKRGYDDWRSRTGAYDFGDMLRRYNEDDSRWEDDDREYDTYINRDRNRQSSQYGYSAEGQRFNELMDALQRWREQEYERERDEKYQLDPDTFYIQVDEDDSGEWQKESLDDKKLEDIFRGSSENDDSMGYEDLDFRVSRNGLDPFQRIGMRLVDLTKDNPSDLSDSNESEMDGTEEGMEQPNAKQPMTMEKARALLNQLEKEEQEREKPEDSSQSKEAVDDAELEAMFNKETGSAENEDIAESDESHKEVSEKNSDEKGKNEKSDESGEGGSDENENSNESYESDSENPGDQNAGKVLEESELQLAKEENRILIEALRKAPIERMQSPAAIQQMKALISSAASRQDLIDYIDSQLSKDSVH